MLGVWVGVGTCLYLILAVAIFVNFTFDNMSKDAMLLQLVRDGVDATATVTSTEEHNGVCYRYTVNGVAHNSCASADYPGELAGTLHPGDQIHVAYSRGDPTKSCACIPPNEYSAATTGPLLAAVFFPIGPAIVLTLVIVRAVKWWRAPRESTLRFER
jgi:hypothetical protein